MLVITEHEPCPSVVDRPCITLLEKADFLLPAGASDSSVGNLYPSGQAFIQSCIHPFVFKKEQVI